TYPVMKVVEGELRQVGVPALNALNARLRDDFIEDCQAGITRWNNEIAGRGIDFEIVLPHVAFNRRIGEFGEISVTPDGGVVPGAEFEQNRDRWLPTSDDQSYIESLMQPELTPGDFAGWIAEPSRGIQGKPTDFEYVKLP
ncbi:MAG: benzoyl-CoA 2,3-epoxidase subunit BoxB, partial [Acidimicrobiia bacterium]